MITRIWDKHGRWCEDKDSIANVAVTYFEDIYSTSNPNLIDEVTVAIPTIVTDEMNVELSKNFTREEIVIALKQIHPTKSPGPNGMSTLFFQKYWDFIGSNVSNMVLNALNSGMSFDVINKTNIALIPKTNNPKRMTDFRPISLCNVIYKLISKTLANRLKVFLPLIIIENQSAFTADKLITNNVLIAYELMHYLKHKREGKDYFMATKLDMSKTFDRVEWGFIEGVMRKIGFNEEWISLVMRCISSISYSVIINGETFGNIFPSRGLRQGDPLLPYLFLLCAKGLSTLLYEATRNQLLNGISLGRGCPKITHLFFVDDSLLFCKANSEECEKLKEILEKYEAASGQKVNSDKSSIYFSPNTTLELKEAIFNILGPMQDLRHNKYMGLPSIIGSSKKQVFAEIKERVGLKLAGWKGKLLSSGGKEILIKAVAQAIPTYTMSCFQLPKSLCDKLERMMRNFWWGQKNQELKIACICWKKMCKPKSLGGLGFRNLQAFNLGLLAKQARRILTNPSSLVARILKAKYFPYCDVLNASLGINPSYTWRSIYNSLEVLKRGTRWRVRNGRRIHIWDDKWLPTPSTFKVITPLGSLKTTPWSPLSLTRILGGGKLTPLELSSSR